VFKSPWPPMSFILGLPAPFSRLELLASFSTLKLFIRSQLRCASPSAIHFLVPAQQLRAIRVLFLSCAADSASGPWSPVFSSSCILFLVTKLGFSQCDCLARLAVCLVSLAGQGARPCSSPLLSRSCLVPAFDFELFPLSPPITARIFSIDLIFYACWDYRYRS
jgi:hypothetical protein